MPKTTKEPYGVLPEPSRTSSPKTAYGVWSGQVSGPVRDRYSNIGTVKQGQRKPGREDPEGEYLTKGGHSVNATKVIKMAANENHGKFSLIATQCPMEDTLNSFFELIYTSKIDAVVVLGKLESERLEDYWNPSVESRDIGNSMYIKRGDHYKLSSVADGSGAGYRVYKITIEKYSKEVLSGKKDLVLFHYYAWPDKNTPTNKDDFEKFVLLRDFENKRKLLVHCSAGIGRTGTFAACLQAWKDKLKDPFTIVSELRGHRSYMVQTAGQFDLVCKFIARNCTDEGKKSKPDWDEELDYEKYFGKSESEIKK